MESEDIFFSVQEADRALKRLAGAMLIHALEDLFSFSEARRDSARDWIARQGASALSFDFCCSVIGQDPERMRNALVETSFAPKADLGRRIVASRTRKRQEV